MAWTDDNRFVSRERLIEKLEEADKWEKMRRAEAVELNAEIERLKAELAFVERVLP